MQNKFSSSAIVPTATYCCRIKMVYFCHFCQTSVPNNQLIVHSKTKRHKLLCIQNFDEDYAIYVVESAFKCRIITYRINGSSKVLDPAIFFNKIEDKILKVIKTELKENACVKINLQLYCTYIQTVEEEVVRDLKSFNTINVVITQTSDLSTFYDNMTSLILSKCEDFQERDSGWALEKIEFLDVNINKYNPLKASSYIPLPKQVSLKKACVNVKNNDNACFFWAVTSALYPAAAHSDRVSSYPRYETVLNTKGVKYPVTIIDVKRFERLNNLYINIYGIETNQLITPLYISKRGGEKKHIDLLYYEKGGKNHYCWIKHLSRLIRKQVSNDKRKYYFCNSCLYYFVDESKLNLHVRMGCVKKAVQLPDEKNKVIKFMNHHHMLKVPFTIYADFESILKPFDSKIIHSRYTHEHIPCSFALYTHCWYDETLSKFQSYRGKDCVDKFIKCIHAEAGRVNTILSVKKPLNWRSSTEEFEVKKSTVCHICKLSLDDKDNIVLDHCHLTGYVRGLAHNQCNLNHKLPSFIPIVFHNLSGYDAHLFIKKLATYDAGDITCIPQTKENYISFTKKIEFSPDTLTPKITSLRFIDSYKFMNSSLDNLARNLSRKDLKIISLHFPSDKIDMLHRKGIYPYEYVDCWEKLDETSLPDKTSFYSALCDSHISDNDYQHAQAIWNAFKIKTLGDYCDLYVKTDVLLLADVFENFRETCLSAYSLDPCQYLTAPSLSWNAMLLATGIELDLLTDYEMVQFIQGGIRGGISQVMCRHAKANNKFMKNYNSNEESSFIIYLDVNNLYGDAMSSYLPTGNFRWLSQNEIDNFDIENQETDAEIGFFLEVDLIYPQSLHDSHKEYPFCPETKPPPHGKQNKLLLTLYDKECYIIHLRNLKQCLQHGVVCKKIRRILSFDQSPWLKKYIDLNTNKRMLATNTFKKNFFKLMNNAVFGKTMENVEKRKNVKLLTRWCDSKNHRTKPFFGAERYISKPNFHSTTIFSEDFIAIQMLPTTVLYDKPIYIGFTILELSKCVMYEFHYDYMLPKYGENIKLLYTDTDSFVYKITTNNFYDDIKADLTSRFDTSDLPPENIYHLPLVNKKVVGKMKDECNGKIITEFIGLRSKMYAYLIHDDNNSIVDSLTCVKKNKGTSSAVVKRIHFENYRSALDLENVFYDNMHTFKTLKHTIYTEVKRKKVLCGNDDKRCILSDNINTLPWGHYSLTMC